MGGLIFKEFHENRIVLSIIYPLCAAIILFSMWLIEAEGTQEASMVKQLTVMISYTILVLAVSIFVTTIFKYDETKLWSCFIQSTPEMARGQVKSKYLFILLNYIIAMSICVIMSFFDGVINESPSGGVSLANIVFWLAILVNAIEIPFVIRFGTKTGNMVRTFISVIILLAVVVALLYGDPREYLQIEAVMSVVEGFITGNLGTEMMWFMALLPIASISAYYLSYRLSCKFYAKGAERFDR